MEPGDPFLTKELDLQRSRQRRVLRLLPDQMVGRLAPSRRLIVKPGEGPVLESVLRDFYDEYVAGEGTHVLQLLERGSEHARLRVTADRLDAVTPEDDYESPQAKAGYWVAEQLRERAQSLQERSVPDEHLSGAALVVGLLCRADEAAGDYCDPRLVPRSEVPGAR